MRMAQEGQQHPIAIYFWIWGLLFVLSAGSYASDFLPHGLFRSGVIVVLMLAKAGFIIAIFIFLLATARGRFHYLSHGLGAVLVFVGIKMAIANWFHFDTYLSLAVIALLLTAAVVLSERRTRRLGRARASEESATSDEPAAPHEH